MCITVSESRVFPVSPVSSGLALACITTVLLLCLGIVPLYSQSTIPVPPTIQRAQTSPKKESTPTQTHNSQANWKINVIENDLKALGAFVQKQSLDSLFIRGLSRDDQGKYVIVSQYQPQVTINAWDIQFFKTEKEMQNDFVKKIEEGWTITAIDISSNSSMVLYYKVSPKNVSKTSQNFSSISSQNSIQMRPIGIRLLKLKSQNELKNSILVYQKLGFLPVALSTYKNQIWLILQAYLEDTTVHNIRIMGDSLSELESVFTTNLQETEEQDTYITAFTLIPGGKFLTILQK